MIDLFEQEATAEENRAENEDQYAELSQEAFEKYYLTIHDSLPVVVRGPSASIVDHAAHGTHRFVHIDASHLYEHVVEDIAAARTLLKPGGVVVFDDFRAPHTPGVAAAVWRATNEDLEPFAVTMDKLYATFDDTQPWLDVLIGWLEERSFWRHEIQQVAGSRCCGSTGPPQAQAGEPSSRLPRRRASAGGAAAEAYFSRCTLCCAAWARGRTTSSSMFTWAGSEATQRTISAMSSATSGSATPS